MTSLSQDPLNQQPGGGCAEINSRNSRRCSLTSLPTGKADCPRIASRVLSLLGARGSPFGSISPGGTLGGLAHVHPLLKSCRVAGHYQACRQAG
jgi:hypothetical protein